MSDSDRKLNVSLAHRPNQRNPQQFLFVNGDEKTAKKQARSHVAKVSYKPKESNRISIKAQVNLPLLWNTVSTALTSTSEIPSVSVTKPNQRPTIKHNSTSSSLNDTQNSQPWDQFSSMSEEDEEEILRLIDNKTDKTGPLTLLGNGQSDPFGSACVAIDARVSQLLRFSREYYVRSRWAAEGKDYDTASAVAIWNLDIQDAVTSRAALHSTLAIAAQYIVNSLKSNQPKRPDLVNKSMHHSLEALAEIRKSLANSRLEEDIIVAILNIVALDGITGRPQTHSTHMKAVLKIAEYRGGFNQLSERVRHSAGIIDTAAAFMLFQPLCLRLEDWDPGCWMRQPLCQKYKYIMNPLLSWESVDPDLVARHYHEPPYPFLRDILHGLHEILVVWNGVSSVSNHPNGPNREDCNEMFKWMTLRRAALKAAILNDYHETRVHRAKTTSTMIEDIITAAVCQVALAFSGFVMYPANTVLAHRPIPSQDKVVNVMRFKDTESFAERPALLLWLSFGGFTIEHLSRNLTSQESRGEPNEEFFVKIFSTVATKLEITSWQHAREYMKLFLYDESMDLGLTALFNAHETMKK